MQGKKKPGPKPGSPKASPLRFDLLEILRAKGFEPAAALVEVHQLARAQYAARLKKSANGFGAQGYLDIARSSATDLMEFIYPKRKAVELTGQDGVDLFQSFTDLMKQVASEEKK